MTAFWAVVVAAGSGERLGAGKPKALVSLGDRPLVWHAVQGLARAGCRVCIVTVPGESRDAFADALSGVGVPTSLVVGGATRQESVRLGLARLEASGGDIVLVHDAARPLVPSGVVSRVVDAVVAGARAVVPAVPVSDSLRRVGDFGSQVVDRAGLWHVQTPQGFTCETLRSAHEALVEAGIEVTDDAAAAEFVGLDVHVVAGDRAGLKITDPFDLLVARQLLAGGMVA